MRIADRYAALFRLLLPAPLTIAIVLTLFTFFLCMVFGQEAEISSAYLVDLISHWDDGLWDKSMLAFALQMMLMLVLGHVLALTRTFKRLIDHVLVYCTSSARTAYLVTLLTITVAFFNWGLGLIFGAIFARRAAEHAKSHNIPLNYPLVGAAGYSGLMVWHGGISGSSPVAVAGDGHLKEMMSGLADDQFISSLPERISFAETIFSPMNLSISLALLIVLPLAMYFLARLSGKPDYALSRLETEKEEESFSAGADKLNHSKVLVIIFSIAVLIALVVRMTKQGEGYFSFLTPDFINMGLLLSGLVLHGSIHRFSTAVDEAIYGASGILIQFPIYFGIMGLMKGSGLVTVLSEFFVSVSNGNTFPLLNFIGACIVNIFIPSGGGQWAIQGPIIIQTAVNMDISLPKCIMSMAYGDQLTNMMQPFWALPLLGITGLKAKEILPYSLYLMCFGFVIFFLGLAIF